MRTTNRTILERLQRSRLLSKPELAQVQAEPSCPARSADVALINRLVECGALTAWQGLQLLAGRTSFFIGPYKLLQRIGQGGVASVYLAQHDRIGHRVALKVFPRGLLQFPDAVARFRRETQASVRVNHPHVVSGFGSKCFSGHGVLIMEYVSGDDLSRWLKRFGTLPIDWCCEVGRQAALGLSHIHQRGLVHRDIKPSNLLAIGASLSEAPHVKITDLGAANIKFSEAIASGTRLTLLGDLLGTPNFVAPEQIEDPHAADHRCDLFSLGCTLFKLLTNGLPWSGARLPDLLKAKMSQPPASIGHLREDIPPRLQSIIETMLARQPADRYSSADEVVCELTEFAGRWANQDRVRQSPAQPEAPPFPILCLDRQDTKTSSSPITQTDATEAPPQQWRLLRASLQGTTHTFPLHEQDTVILGRARDCHIRVRDEQVSRRHCQITWAATRWRIEDLGSANGTYVNGQQVRACDLHNGDHIRIGSTQLWLIATSDADADEAIPTLQLALEQSGPASA